MVPKPPLGGGHGGGGGVSVYVGFGRYHMNIFFKFGSKMLISFQVTAKFHKYGYPSKFTKRGGGGSGFGKK